MDEVFFNAVVDGFQKGLPNTFGVLKTLTDSDPCTTAQLDKLHEVSKRIRGDELKVFLLNSRVPTIKAELVQLNTAQIQRGLRKQMVFEFRDKIASLETAIRDKIAQMEDLNASIKLIEENKISLSKEYETLHRQMLDDVPSEAKDAKRIMVLTAQLQELLPGDTPVPSQDVPEWLQQIISEKEEVPLGKLEEGTPLMVGKSSYLDAVGIRSMQGIKSQQPQPQYPEDPFGPPWEDEEFQFEDFEDEFIDDKVGEKTKKRQTRFSKWSLKLFPKGFWFFLGVSVPLALWEVVKWILLLLWRFIKWVFSQIVKLFDWFIFGKEESKPEEKPENIPPVGQGMEG